MILNLRPKAVTITGSRLLLKAWGEEVLYTFGLKPLIGLRFIHILGYGYIGARNDATQQSGQTPDKEVEIVWLHLIRHACPDF